MDDSFYDDVYNTLIVNIDLLVSPQDATLAPSEYGGCIPQKKYAKGAGRDLPTNQNLVLFVREDRSFIPVTAAVGEDYTGLVSRDIPALDTAGFTITVRFEWPGYSSQDFQLRTYDWRAPPERISISKLATEVGKIVQQFIEKNQGQQIAPGFENWRVGPNGIQAKHLYLAALEQVSAGSWQPRLFYKP